MRNIFIKVVSVIGGILALITGAYSIYHEAIEDKNPAINISVDKAEHATQISKVTGLKAKYAFNDRGIKDLWIVDVSFENTSNATIIGKGDKKNIIGDSIALKIFRPFKLLDAIFTNTDFNDLRYDFNGDTTVAFSFVQWRPKEKFKLRFFIEGDTSATEGPNFWMNDRQIIDGNITYSKNGQIQFKSIIEEKITNPSLLFALGILACFVFAEGLIILLFASFEYTFRLIKYRTWKSKHYADFTQEVKRLMEEKVLLKKYEPYNLPDEFWHLIKSPKPKKSARDNSIVGDGVVFLLVTMASAIALLWIVPYNFFDK